MTGILDLFAIGFQSDGIKDFEKNLKLTEAELDKAEKKVINLENQLKDLEKQGKTDEEAIKKVKEALARANAEASNFGDKLKILKGKSEYQIIALKKNFASLIKSLGLLATVTIAVKQSMQFYEQGEQLDFLAQKTNIAIDSLQRLGNAAQRYGGSTEGTATTVQQFKTKEFREQALKAGISISGDNPERTLENIAAKMEKLKSDSQKWELASSLGLDEGTTRLLIQGVERYREELKKADKYKLYTKEDIEQMRDYRQIQQDIKYGIQNIQAVISRMLLPIITAVSKALRGITDWLSEHEGAVKIAGVFLGIAAAVGAATIAVNLLNAAFAFLAANPVVLAIIAIIAGITLLVAIIQDFITFLQGGESVIGEIFQSIGEWINETVNMFKTLGGKIAEFGQKIKALWDAIPDPIKKLIGMTNPVSGTFTMVNIAKEQLQKANNNRLNSVPPGAVSNYNQTQAINNNNNANTQSINNTKTNQKTLSVNSMTIQTQATDGKGLMQEMQAIMNLDNGILV